MARPLSEQKREAILAAAAQQVAALGTSASTARIARAASVSEGTLFTYFATKDELLNQLFLAIEAEFAEALLKGAPEGGEPRERARFVWDRLVDWGVDHPVDRKALRQLKVSDRITEATRYKTGAIFRDLKRMLEEGIAGHVAPDLTATHVFATLDALIGMTLDLINGEPERRDHYKRTGFDLFWKGIGR